MERQMEEVVAFVRERKQFGSPIGRFQAVGHKVVDMRSRLDSARLLLYRACWLKDQGQDAMVEISMAKLAVSEAAVQNGLDAVQIFGGEGILADRGIDVALRDALPSRIFSGTSEMQRNVIARGLGVG
jgi:alkylation response protein AidB-like acyl-CoA dehydrogenase